DPNPRPQPNWTNERGIVMAPARPSRHRRRGGAVHARGDQGRAGAPGWRSHAGDEDAQAIVRHRLACSARTTRNLLDVWLSSSPLPALQPVIPAGWSTRRGRPEDEEVLVRQQQEVLLPCRLRPASGHSGAVLLFDDHL